VNYLQLPDHTFKAKLSSLELLIYADVWTMQQTGKSYWKSNATIARQFAVRRTSVLRSIASLEEKGLIHRVDKSESQRFIEALIPDANSLRKETSLRAETSLQMESGSLQKETGVVSEMHSNSLQMETQIENKREEEKNIQERRAKPRDLEEVIRLFKKAGHGDLAVRFFNHWESRGWKVQPGMRLSDWKAAAANFIDNEERNSKARSGAEGPRTGSRGAVPWRDELHQRIRDRYTGQAE